MAQKSPARKLMDSQHVKGSETLLKSTRQKLCHILRSIWKNFSSKSSFLVVSQILRLFGNIFAPNNKLFLSVEVSI